MTSTQPQTKAYKLSNRIFLKRTKLHRKTAFAVNRSESNWTVEMPDAFRICNISPILIKDSQKGWKYWKLDRWPGSLFVPFFCGADEYLGTVFVALLRWVYCVWSRFFYNKLRFIFLRMLYLHLCRDINDFV